MQFQHPNVHREFVEYSETELLHVVGVYSNPFRWQRRRHNFTDFQYHMRSSPNVRLYTVEVAFGDRPFEVTGNDPYDIQLRTDCMLWNKEQCINIGAQHFPAGWKYGGYVDGEFHMNRHDWALEAVHMLQHHSFVQLMSTYCDMTGETATSYLGHRPFLMRASFAWNYLHQEAFLQARKTGQPDSNYYMPLVKSTVFPFGYAPGATGGGWAWRRDAFDMVGGMLDVCILGSADYHMAFGLVQANNTAAELKRCTAPYVEAVLQWQARAVKLSNNTEGRSPVGCVDNFGVHHFHGFKRERKFGERWNILLKHDFNPRTDLTRDNQGLWRWTGNKPALRDDIIRYMTERAEDGPMLLGDTPLV